jgi:hypothetical protein
VEVQLQCVWEGILKWGYFEGWKVCVEEQVRDELRVGSLIESWSIKFYRSNDLSICNMSMKIGF